MYNSTFEDTLHLGRNFLSCKAKCNYEEPGSI